MAQVRTETRQCARCHALQDRSAFYVREKDRLSSWCRECIKTSNRERRLANPERRTYNPDTDGTSHRQRRYGLSKAKYETMVADQGGRCAICRRFPSGKGLCVDHDHNSGQIRGLLCPTCNWALGHMQDNPDWLNEAITY